MDHAILFDLTEKDQIEIINLAISTLLLLINKSKHRGVHKIWILQHLVPCLQWPLLIYEVTISTVLRFEQKISSYLTKWLLYCSISPCPLPIKKLSSILKSYKSKWLITVKGFFGFKCIISKNWSYCWQMECFWSNRRCRK